MMIVKVLINRGTLAATLMTMALFAAMPAQAQTTVAAAYDFHTPEGRWRQHARSGHYRRQGDLGVNTSRSAVSCRTRGGKKRSRRNMGKYKRFPRSVDVN